MATESECPFYVKCGYVTWRTERPDPHIAPLPEDGDCGKVVTNCPRVNHPNLLAPETPGPQTDEELRIGLPTIPNPHNRPEKRLSGGGFRD